MNPFVHPTAVVDDGAVVGEGSKIWHFCHLMSGARLGAGVVCGQNVFIAGSVAIGDRCRIQNNVSLYDGVVLAEDVFVGPSAVFTNVRRPRAAFPRKGAYETTFVGAGATIGANATIVCGSRLGVCCFIAAGAVVTRDVPDFALMVGSPARRLGWVCRCGERLDAVEEAGATRSRQTDLACSAQSDLACSVCARRYRAAEGSLIELGS